MGINEILHICSIVLIYILLFGFVVAYGAIVASKRNENIEIEKADQLRNIAFAIVTPVMFIGAVLLYWATK